MSDADAPGAGQKAVTTRNVNGRNVPIESVEEHVVSNSGGTRVIERIAECKLRQRRLTDDGNVEIDGRDLRERDTEMRQPETSAQVQP